MDLNKKVSCIIPVYNEADRVGSVLDAITFHELVDEVIVINDGSTDNTEKLLHNRPGINFLSLDRNRGKSYAMMHGIEAAQNDIIMMIDSDLIGLKKENITDLIEPIIKNTADITISLRKNSLFVFRWLGLDFVSGERVFSRSLIPDIHRLGNLKGYEIESFMNRFIIKNKSRIRVVNFKNVLHPMKFSKIGFWRGTRADLKMVLQIISFLGPGGLVKQYWQMLKLKV